MVAGALRGLRSVPDEPRAPAAAGRALCPLPPRPPARRREFGRRIRRRQDPFGDVPAMSDARATNAFNPLAYPVCFAAPRRLAQSAWTQHVPFGMAVIDLVRPQTVVELGTHY